MIAEPSPEHNLGLGCVFVCSSKPYSNQNGMIGETANGKKQTP
jgi:hypothetical protein